MLSCAISDWQRRPALDLKYDDIACVPGTEPGAGRVQIRVARVERTTKLRPADETFLQVKKGGIGTRLLIRLSMGIIQSRSIQNRVGPKSNFG
jgi:hypothetical protein